MAQAIQSARSYHAVGQILKKKIKLLARSQGNYPFRTSAEKRYSENLTRAGVEWIYEGESFLVEIDGELRGWVPDFYLPGERMFVEISGRKTTIKDEKIRAFRSQYPLIKLIEIRNEEIP